jgi:hypothetical protein
MFQRFSQSVFGGVDEWHTSQPRYSQLESSALEKLLDKRPEDITRDRYTKFEDQTLTVTGLLSAEAVPRGRGGIPG